MLFTGYSIFSQEQKISPSKEYASVYLKAFYQGNTISYDRKGASKSPLISMPDGKTYILENFNDPKNPLEFQSVNQILNYMASYGWSLTNSNILPYEGGGGNDSKTVLLNTNQYCQYLIFERPSNN